jgi:hypothetical protein
VPYEALEAERLIQAHIEDVLGPDGLYPIGADNEYLTCESRADIGPAEEEEPYDIPVPVPHNYLDLIKETPMFDPVEREYADETPIDYARIQPFDGNHFMLRLPNPTVGEITLTFTTDDDVVYHRTFCEIPEMKSHMRGLFSRDERVFFEVEND